MSEIRVFRFGLLPPVENAALVEEQMRLAHRYRNDLVYIEKQRRAALRAVHLSQPAIAEAAEACARANKALEDALSAAAKHRGAERTRKIPIELRQAVSEARAEHREAVRAHREARLEAKPKVAAAVAEIDAKALLLQKGARKICGVYWGCVDEETEILTLQGWKKRAAFVGTEHVATYNLSTQRLEWQVATGKTETQYKGPMTHVKNARLDMLLTPNHRVVLERAASRSGARSIEVQRVDEMPKQASSVRIPQAAPGLSPLQVLDVSPALASVLGWVLSDGHLPRSNASVIISQSHAVNERYCTMIREDLLAAGLLFTEKKAPTNGMTTFRIPAAAAFPVRRWIPEKLLTPELVFGLSDKAAKCLLEALLYGDGTHHRTSTGRPRWRWIQKNETNVALFQALALRLGHASHATKREKGKVDSVHTVSVRLQPYATWQSQKGDLLRQVDFSGVVWCPSTPNTTWVARRNGTIFITGNSYLLVEQAMEASRKMPLYDREQPNDPRFVRASGEGTVGVQLQGGLSAEAARAAGDNRIRIVPRDLPKGADPNSKRSLNRPRSTLRLRVSSDGRDPVWASFPMIESRPIPKDAQIKWATVHKHVIGFREEWVATLTVELSAVKHRCGVGTVGVDLGWRKVPEGIRVAYWRGSDGRHGSVVVPDTRTAHAPGMLDRIRQCEGLRATRDKNFDIVRAGLVQWLAEPREIPVWLREATVTLGQWKAQKRLLALVHRWRQNRFAGDEMALQVLQEWRDQERHLYQWESDQRISALRYRREIYRVAAAKLASEYETLVIEDLDLRELAKTPPKETTETAAAPYQRQSASPSEARMALVQAFGGLTTKVGTVWAPARVKKAPAPGTTLTCHVCGSLEDVAVERIDHTCGGCGTIWDQDFNAAVNLCTWRDTSEPGEEVAAIKGGRWAKAKAKKATRVAEATS